MKTSTLVLTVCFLASGSSSCIKRAFNTSESEPHAVVSTAHTWPQRDIPFCFVTSTVSPEVKADVRNAIESEYHQKTIIRFTGFNDCTPDDLKRAIVRFRLNPEKIPQGYGSFQAGQSWLGPVRQPLPGEREATTWIAAPVKWEDTHLPKNAILSAAIHELGHVVGMEHEQTRLNSTSAEACRRQWSSTETIADQQSEEYNGTIFGTHIYVGEYDPNSIMNYCNTKSELSRSDLAGIALLYPTPQKATPTLAGSTIKIVSWQGSLTKRLLDGNPTENRFLMSENRPELTGRLWKVGVVGENLSFESLSDAAGPKFLSCNKDSLQYIAAPSAETAAGLWALVDLSGPAKQGIFALRCLAEPSQERWLSVNATTQLPELAPSLAPGKSDLLWDLLP